MVADAAQAPPRSPNDGRAVQDPQSAAPPNTVPPPNADLLRADLLRADLLRADLLSADLLSADLQSAAPPDEAPLNGVVARPALGGAVDAAASGRSAAR